MPDLELELAKGWKEVPPRTDGPDVLVEIDGRLWLCGSDLEAKFDLGLVGPVECPIAVDGNHSKAFRFVSKAGFGRGADYCQLRAYDLKTGIGFPLLDLPLNQWVLWLLEWIPGNSNQSGQLFGLLAVDRNEDIGVRIDHQLFTMAPGESYPRCRPIARDAYHPLALSRKRRELLFAGGEGSYVLGLRGERKHFLPRDTCPVGEGASFDPTGAPRAVLAGPGVHFWFFEEGRCERLTRIGRYPVWSPDGLGIWYRESSSELHWLNLETGSSHRMIGVAGQREKELWFAKPIAISACGRFGAVSLTGRRLRGLRQNASSGGARERVFRHQHVTVVMDLQRKEVWQAEGGATQLRWVT